MSTFTEQKYKEKDFLQGTHLEQTIKKYSFFNYRINEALHMTMEEHDILVSLMQQMRNDLEGQTYEVLDEEKTMTY